MSITQLRTLLAIAKSGSFRSAADIVCVTPAAVGHQMRQLEATMDAVLFDRSEHQPTLTPFARSLLVKTQEVVDAYDALMQGGAPSDQFSGDFALGAIPSTLAALVPKSVKRLVSVHEDLSVRVVPGLSDDLQEQVLRGRLDAAVLSPSYGVDEGLLWQPFIEERLVLLVGPDVELADPKAMLASEPYIRHTRRSAVGILADAWLRDAGIHVKPVMEMESLATVTGMVASGLGVSIVPDVCVPDAEFAALRKVSLEPHGHSRVLGLLTRADTQKPLIAEQFLTHIQYVIV